MVDKKEKFDTEAFVFETPIEKIEEWVKYMCDSLDDPEEEWPSAQEQDWLAVWLRDLPYYRAHGLKKTLTCAKENAIMGLYEKPKRRKKK